MNQPQAPTSFLTTSEVAERLRVTSGTVRQWRVDAVGPRFIQVGTIYRYPLRDLEEWISERLAQSLVP